MSQLNKYKKSYQIEKINENSKYKKIYFSKNRDVLVAMDIDGNLKVTFPENKNLTFIEQCDDFILSEGGNFLFCMKSSFRSLKIKVINFSEDCFRELNCSGSLYSVKISPKEDLFYIKSIGQITFFTMKCVFLFDIFDSDIELGDTNFSEDGNSFYYITNEFIKIYDITKKKLKKKIKEKYYINSIFLEKNIITYSYENNIVRYSMKKNKIIKTENHNCNSFKNLQYSPNKFFMIFEDFVEYNSQLKIYCEKYGFLGKIILNLEDKSIQITNNELSFLTNKSTYCIIDLYSKFNLHSLFKPKYIITFLSSLNKKESSISIFGNNNLSDVKNLTSLIFDFI